MGHADVTRGAMLVVDSAPAHPLAETRKGH